MENQKKLVIEAYREIAKNSVNKEITINDEISRELGFDSLGMVEFIINLEEKLDIELDNCLAEIRNAKTIGDVINILNQL